MPSPLTVSWLDDEDASLDHFYLIPGNHVEFFKQHYEIGTNPVLDGFQYGAYGTLEYERQAYTAVETRIDAIIAFARYLDLPYFLSYSDGSLLRFEKIKNYRFENTGEVELVYRKP